MEAALVRERYKLVRVLRREDHYVCAEAVDILDREKRSCLLNLYDGPLLRTYLPCFDRLEHFPACRGALLDGERLVTVFDLPEGTPAEQAFHRRDRRSWRERLDYAALLMEQVLNLADVDPAVSCPALLPENVLVDERAGRLRLRFAAAPMEDASDQTAARLAAAALKTVLPRRRSWTCWRSWTGTTAARWSSSTPCGGGTRAPCGTGMRRWNGKTRFGAGYPSCGCASGARCAGKKR